MENNKEQRLGELAKKFDEMAASYQYQEAYDLGIQIIGEALQFLQENGGIISVELTESVSDTVAQISQQLKGFAHLNAEMQQMPS